MPKAKCHCTCFSFLSQDSRPARTQDVHLCQALDTIQSIWLQVKYLASIFTFDSEARHLHQQTPIVEAKPRWQGSARLRVPACVCRPQRMATCAASASSQAECARPAAARCRCPCTGLAFRHPSSVAWRWPERPPKKGCTQRPPEGLSPSC